MNTPMFYVEHQNTHLPSKHVLNKGFLLQFLYIFLTSFTKVKSRLVALELKLRGERKVWACVLSFFTSIAFLQF